MSHSDPSFTHIPPFAKPLAPYIKSRQEVLRIRQALTSYLRSQIVFAEGGSESSNCHAQSHLSLCVPQDAVVDVKRSSDFTGLRKKYLSVLRANLAARQEYKSVSERGALDKKAGNKGKVPRDPSSELQTYLQLLRDRRRHAKLQTFQHYLQELKARENVHPEDFDNKESRELLLPEEFEDGSSNVPGADGGVEGLVHKLERAVLRAKSQLDREKKLFDEIKERHDSEKVNGEKPGKKVVALQRTRDELVQWVEEKLMGIGTNDDGPVEDVPPEEIEESTQLLEERKAQITAQYAAYVEARKGLLDAASKSCQPVVPAPKPQIRADSWPNSPDEVTLEPLNVLMFAGQSLLPLSKSQRALALQKSYMSGLLAKEKSTTLRALNRLSDESHLLPEYPMIARQLRSRQAGRMHSRHSSIAAEQIKPDEVVNKAEAWAFASESAGNSERDYVEQKLAIGEETAEDAQKALQEVYGMLNQDLEADDAEDSSETRITRSQARLREKRTNGVWAKLDGSIAA